MKTKMKIKKFVDNDSLSWEERFKALENHHKEETEFLIQTIEDLEERIINLELEIENDMYERDLQ